MNLIRDKYKRLIDYMRISVTDRCNLRCIYCMPSDGIKPVKHTSILSYEEIIRIVRIAADLGVRRIRITGGEPLTRRNLTYLISSINKIEGIEEISLTTNGQILEEHIKDLALAGLKRVNISLDSLDPERYRSITRGGDIGKVLAGIERTERLGLLPIKINMVPVKGFNDDEIENFARLTLITSYHIRFIEFMPIGARDFWSTERYIPSDTIKKRAACIAPLIPVTLKKSGPAEYFQYAKAKGVIGFISPISNHFCDSCNRLRLTSEGKIRPCLFSETEIDLKSAMRGGAKDDEIERLLRLSIEIKPSGHAINDGGVFEYHKPISKIGG